MTLMRAITGNVPEWIVPDWPIPDHVKALTTLRSGGISSGVYASLNLAAHVGDNEPAVAENRARLIDAACLPAMPVWLKQIHGANVVEATSNAPGMTADASFTGRDAVVCAVLTADCLPVLLYDRCRNRIAAIHAGWRGLAAGVIEAAINTMASRGEDLLAWLGPAIGSQAFEVGGNVREIFTAHDAASEADFRPSYNAGRWFADIYGLARRRLRATGVPQICGGGLCTFTDAERFYSYRRDGATGRMATLIWMSNAR